MLFDDTYRTIIESSQGVFRDKGSKFIAYAFPIRSEEDFKSQLTTIKGEHARARHHCWAFRLSPDRNVFRLNDDGEPSGTAGRPILNSMLSADLTNIGVVVVRYFGGTLLGVPGLISAYKTATSEALMAAAVVEKTVNDIYSLSFDYLSMNDVMRVIKDENLVILKQDYEDRCMIELEVRKGQLNKVLDRLGKIGGLEQSYLYTV